MWKNLFEQIRIQVSLSKLDFSDILEFFVVLGWGSKGGEAPNLKKNISMFFFNFLPLSSNFLRKTDTSLRTFWSESAFLSLKFLRKNIRQFFSSLLGFSPPCPPPTPKTFLQNQKYLKNLFWQIWSVRTGFFRCFVNFFSFGREGEGQGGGEDPL